MRYIVTLFVAVLLCAAVIPAHAQDDAPLRKEIQDLKDLIKQTQSEYQAKIEALQEQVKALSDKIETAEITQETQSEVIDALQKEAEAATRTATAAGAQQSMNPDMSAIVDWAFVSQTGNEEPGHNDDKFSLREVELGYSADIDPYARADVFLGIHEGHEHGHAGLVEHDAEAEWRHEESEEDEDAHAAIHIEEAYLTLPRLGPSLQAKVGKFLPEFGRANTTHLHAFPWGEFPRPQQIFLGEEGMRGVGISLGWLLPMRHFSELVLQAFNAESPSFADACADSPAYLAHWKNFLELSPASALEIGFSYATGPNDPLDSGSNTRLLGADLTYKWRPPQEGLYKSVWWQTEGYWSRRDLEEGDSENAWGMYSSLTYQFDRRWSVGARYDYVEDPFDSAYRERSLSLNTTLSPSEFAFWRLEYRRVHPNFTDTRDEYLLQYNFGIGPHRAHKF